MHWNGFLTIAILNLALVTCACGTQKNAGDSDDDDDNTDRTNDNTNTSGVVSDAKSLCAAENNDYYSLSGGVCGVMRHELP
ncbi:MAG: hypothetical protein JXR76_19485 [Deltaproteobacteria bacterium]|nr:hypothetical protein [Deltaproteobacteria bacterium]